VHKRPHLREQKKPQEFNNLTGEISINSRAVGFLVNEKGGQDIMIESEHLNTALPYDEVEVKVTGKDKGRVKGSVTRVIKRYRTRFVGTVEKLDGTFILKPDDTKVYTPFKIVTASKGLAPKEKALVELLPWTDPKQKPEATLIRIIGKAGEHNTEMHSIVLAHGFDTEFAPEVEQEAEALKAREKEIFAEELKTRRDLRATPTFTIDPADAKDFDDAISFKKLQNDEFEIGVHIADVSYFVREGGPLDREARERGFSVYLVDRTIPMLPEVLSNDLCSLNPNEDKLAFSAIFRMKRDGTVLSRTYEKTVIKSHKRFSYEEAQKVLDSKTGPHFEALDTLNGIAKRFMAEKFKKGAIDFETEEVRFELDAKGRPLRVYKKARLDTHKLIEEWMLLANRAVAEFMWHGRSKRKQAEPFLYRTHDVPDPEKIERLALFVKALGHDLSLKRGTVTGKDLQALFKRISGKAEESLIKTSTLRSMTKAVYSTENIGHFGLAFPYYTHFTSPIRRYADLIVHRLLELELQKKSLPEKEWAKYRSIAMSTTEREIEAAQAERESIKYKQVEYMQERIGQEFDGVISGITEWGIYVEEKETKSEGMVKLRDLKDDYYRVDEKNYCIVGERTKKKYSLGDRVRFKIIAADVERKTLDYALA